MCGSTTGRCSRRRCLRSGTGILPVSPTGVSPVEEQRLPGPRWPCDTWARCPCYRGTRAGCPRREETRAGGQRSCRPSRSMGVPPMDSRSRARCPCYGDALTGILQAGSRLTVGHACRIQRNEHTCPLSMGLIGSLCSKFEFRNSNFEFVARRLVSPRSGSIGIDDG